MNDREIFRENLNYYLNKSGKLQKELAEAIGSKYTTVSGWTRGISYPRAEAMEKIADFFGIPTSQLVGERKDDSPEPDQRTIRYSNNEVIRKVLTGMARMSPLDYEVVMEILERTEQELKKRGDWDNL